MRYRSHTAQWITLLILLTAAITRSRQLTSRTLTNIAAFSLPAVSEVNSLYGFQDKSRQLRSIALMIDPNNSSAEMQTLRWLRSTEQTRAMTPPKHLADAVNQFVNWYDMAWFFEKYAQQEALMLSESGDLTESVKYHYLALARSSGQPERESLSPLLDALARLVLSDQSAITAIARSRAGKLYQLSGQPDLALEQAMQMSNEPQMHLDSTAREWASWVQAQASYRAGNVETATEWLQSAIALGKAPAAASLLIDIARTKHKPLIEETSRQHLAQLAPDWSLGLQVASCLNTWELAGLDIDRDLLATSPIVKADLYWIPQCNQTAAQYGLIDTGRYWIQPNYVVQNDIVDPGSEWILPPEATNFTASPPDCYNYSTEQDNRVLRITQGNVSGTSAVSSLIPMRLPAASFFVVGGRFKWEQSTTAKFAHAILGGHWLSEIYIAELQPEEASNPLQEFIVLPHPDSDENYYWQAVAELVYPPKDTAYFSLWLGVSTSWRPPPSDVQIGGTAVILADDLFLLPICPPHVCPVSSSLVGETR